MYVDSATGKTWVNYYAMRSGKTNALAFANNAKLFKRLTQFIGGEEIQTDEDKFQYKEPMRNVDITVDNESLENINATIAKAVLWIQASFTCGLGHNNPTDEEIEKARFMTWNIDNFMLACSLKDRRKAIESMRRMLKILSNATIRWQEYVNVRDKEGNLVYSGTYKDKDGKKKPKIKQALQTYEGHFISTRTLKPIGGEFEYWINKEFATYLAHAGVIAVHEKIFQINAQKNANALTLAVKLNEYYFMNKGKPQANIIGVKNLLKAMPGIPSYSDLTTCVTVTKDNGQQQSYTKRGDKGGWRTRIQKPFEAALESLVDDNILIEWCYRENVDPNNYYDFENQYIYFVPNNI